MPSYYKVREGKMDQHDDLQARADSTVMIQSLHLISYHSGSFEEVDFVIVENCRYNQV